MARQKRPNPVDLVERLRRRMIILSILMTGCVGFGIWSITQDRNLVGKNRTLVVENRNRINDIKDLAVQNASLIKQVKRLVIEIQDSRVSSCKQTYMVIRSLIIKSAAGRKLTKNQQKQFDKFLNLANPAKCVKQTKPKPPPG